jgi:D-alanine-D-alanine ligase-like ATP-grasp enzyme
MHCHIKIVGVIPLSEVAVEVSDTLAAGLSLPHNPLHLMTALSVASKGLRVAKFSRVKTLDHICNAMEKLSLSYPVVVKTPSGMSTSDVFICSNKMEASDALLSIAAKTSPDGRMTSEALLEEYVHGTEFAVNLMAFWNIDAQLSHLLVTDMWKYNKNERARYVSADICNPDDYPELVQYATEVAHAVGIQYGAAHVELKAAISQDGTYTNPTLIEVGARLSGGRKSTMALLAVDKWNPFVSLILSHCGKPCQFSSTMYLTPHKFVRHLFLPIEKPGRVVKFDFNDSLKTIYSASRLAKIGDVVAVTTDILSCAGFVWLVGDDQENVDSDTRELLLSFVLTVESL